MPTTTQKKLETLSNTPLLTQHIQYNIPKKTTDNQLIELYKALVYPRLIEEKMLKLLRQGKISKWFSGIGQEAISVGVTMALHPDEYVCPLHRNLGVFTTRQMPFDKLFMQWQGKYEGYSKGRERSFHFGSNEHHIVGMISHLGPQLAIASGIALAHKLNKEPKLSVAFSGEGGTSEGDFHEALNVAAVWQLPVIFVVENNGYGLSTTTTEQFKCKNIIDKGIGYGIETLQLDGNNIIEVFTKINEIAQSIRKKPRPILVECLTFRMRGHEEASGTKYVPKQIMEEWAKKDPVTNYENFLLNQNKITYNQIEEIKNNYNQLIDNGLETAFALPDISNPQIENEIKDLYAPHTPTLLNPSNPETTNLRFIDAISNALQQAMQQHPNLVLMGQDIAEYGGVFKITENFVQQFGKERVRNTPLCESAIVGIGLGLSIKKMKAMVEMQFADFVTCGFNQIVNNLAKIHYRWGQNADVVVRMPTGAGVGAGPFHSQSNEAWFFHTPGLKIVYPSSPYDAKGLLLAALEDPNPVLFFEHKLLYRSVQGNVPTAPYTLPIGKANLLQQGKHLTIITYGMGVHWATQTLQKNTHIKADLIDLRTLQPLDTETIYKSVKKTGKAIILHEDCLTGGIGAEISALITQNCFQFLDAPVLRCASLDTPIPFAIPLEQQFLPPQRFEKMLIELYEF